MFRQIASRLLGPPDLDEVFIVFRVIGKSPGVMVDVGAHQGYALEPFLKRGWIVHAFEPDPSNRAILSSRCPAAVIDPRAVAESDNEEVPLYTSDVSTGISTLSPFHNTHTATASVRTVRLDTYLRDRKVDHVDFLKTDIEGFDLFALRTFPWESGRPKAVVCEFEDNKTKRLGHDVHETARFLQAQGYVVVVSEWEPIKEYGSRHKWRRFDRYPVELAGDSWGNLIGIEPQLLPQLERVGRFSARRLRIRQWVDRVRRAR
jgi:FkbM family methyltransferase